MSFEERKAANAKKTQIRNQDLPARSPMYYYCRLCEQVMVLPESHLSAAPKYCEWCIDEGLAKNPQEKI